ncbi:MAG: peptidoglycan DD-metalloendopeptidase family protein [Candidatus Eremiobacterota bacterium]
MAIILMLLGHPSLAQPPSRRDLEDRLEAARRRLKGERWRLNVMNERARDVSSQLGETQAQLGQARARMQEARTRLSLARHRLESLRQNIRRTEARLKRSQLALETRLRGIYEEGEVNYAAVLLEAESFTDFLNQSEYLQRIVESDQQLIGEVRARRQELERQKRAAQRTVDEVARQKRAFEEQEGRLASLETRRRKLLSQVRSERDAIASRVDELQHSSAELEAQLEQLIRARQADGGYGPAPAPSAGGYILPVRGWITSPFGYRVHPIRGTTIFHSGLDIAAESGTPIRAADNGRVIYSGWYGGYGYAVILDHGDGYSTLYGHCSALHVYEGQSVSQGHAIASVGSTGMSTGPHLHFEVRYHGNPVDPRGRL